MKLKSLKFKSVKSTNDIAHKLIKEKKIRPTIIVSEKQTKGRGTMGKKWISKKGNLFLTIFFDMSKKNVDFKRIKKLDRSVILIYTHQSLEILVKNLTTYEMEKIILICASERILKLALNYSFEDCVLAESALDKHILDAAIQMIK